MKYRVRLTDNERRLLLKKVSSGAAPAREILHAHILLKVDQGGERLTDAKAARALGVSSRTVQRVRERRCKEGLLPALARKPQPPRPQKRRLTDEAEARLVAVACSAAPEGRVRWTLRLLSRRMLELGFSLSHESVRRALKKTNCALTGSSAG